MKHTLFGILVGYGICWALNTPQGRNFVGNTQRTISSMEASLGKALTPKQKGTENGISTQNEDTVSS